jgi:hypothetical protein
LIRGFGIFIIVDFGASQNHTHHKESIFSFARLIGSKNYDFEVWIPKGSEIQDVNLPIKYKILPGFNPIGFNVRKISTWVAAIHGKLHNYSNLKNLKFVLHILAIFNSFHFILLILHKKLSNKNIKLLFPTFCPFSIHLLSILELLGISTDTYCRLTNTSERRGKLSIMFSLIDFIEASKKFNHVKVRFGIETDAYMDTIRKDKTDSRYFTSKFPSAPRKYHSKEHESKITISFLGYPTRHKGQQHILPIIEKVSLQNPNVKWQLQTRDNDSILGELSKLKNLDVNILPGKISEQMMISALKSSTVICLPYDVDAFKLNSSAMMYQASDYLLPIFTFSGSAFATDVERFKCGRVAQDEEHLIEILADLNHIQISNWVNGCINYNSFRNESNYTFLNITKNA